MKPQQKVVSFDNRINGTITGATWTSSGKYGSALYFDGTGDYVDLGTTNVLCPLNFSVELWMKPSSFVGSNPSTAFSKWDVSNTGFFLRKANSATPYYFYIGDGSGGWGTGYIAIDTGTMTEEQWHHVIGTYNGSKLILYVDGAQVSSYDWNKYTCSTAKFYVGTYGPDISQVFQGAIDEVIMYNRSLSADEVAFNYNSNLYKYNSTNFVLEINKTNLEVGEYNYSVILEDDEGVSTSSRTFDYLGPQLTTFLSPTPSNNETIGNNSVIINATISSSNLTNVIFNWEGQNVNLTPYLSSSNYNSFYYSGNGSNVTPWIKGNGLRDCQAYLKYYNKGSGIYYINPTKGNYSSIYRVYCDMTTDNGGWTLVASVGNNYLHYA